MRFSRHLTAHCLLFALGLSPGAGAIAQAIQPSLSEAIRFDIPAQPLASALLTLGREANLEISFPPDAVQGKQAAAVHGTLTPMQVLNQWLEGSGLVSRSGGAGRIIISVGTRSPIPVASLDAIRTQAEPPGSYTYTSEQIRHTPSSNRDLSALVENHPAIRIDNASSASTNRGSMNVDDISIHGASPYQNLFQIDGMDASSNLDPASKNQNLQIGNVPSNAQAYFVDTSLLDSVKVLDSFIPSEYGRFTGGVIDSRLRRASGDNSLRFTYRHNNSGMTKQKVSESNLQDFENGALGYSREWRKHFLSVAGDYSFNEKAGMVLNLSRRQSRIKRNIMTVNEAGDPGLSTETHNDQVDNLLGKFSLRVSPSTITDLTLKYSQREENLGHDFFRDTRWEHNHTAYGLAWNLEHSFQGGRYTLQAGYDHFLDSRDSSESSLLTHFFVGRTGDNFTTGGFGEEETSRDTYTLKNRIDFDPFSTGAMTHTPYIGLDIQRIDSRFKRHRDAYAYQRRYFQDGTIQERSKNLHHKGEIDVDYQTYSAYASNRMDWNRLSLTLGARYDKETFIGNANLSPRSRLDWDPTDTGDTVLSAGWNRYHGDNILEIGWREEKAALRQQLISGTGVPVIDGWASPEYTRYKELRTPYDDEWAFQLAQRIHGVQARLSFVRRNGRDHITREGSGTSATPYVYTNNGYSRTRTWSLMLHNIEPWHKFGASWQLNASISHGRQRTNTNLSDGYEENVGGIDDYILFNGERMLRVNRPGIAFNRPSQAILGLTGYWPSQRITWNNTAIWKGPRDAISYVGLGPAPERLERYETVRVASYWTWDASVTWAPRTLQGLELSVELLNVLNKQPTVVPTAPNRNGNQNLYRTGRELWLQASYQF